MTDISEVQSQAELNQLIIQNKVSNVWDNVYIEENRYQVVRIDGKVHSIGGRWGDNEFWAYPIGEQISYENLLAFSGHVLCWGIITEDINYEKHKWNTGRVRSSNRTWITLNGKKLVSVMGSMEYALSKAQVMIIEMSEGNINFNEYDWMNQIVGRKIFYHNEPAVIKSVCSNDLDLIIVPDGIEFFTPPCWLSKESDFDLEEWQSDSDDCKTSFNDPAIYWHRD